MKINVCGCALMDNLYTDISFSSAAVKKYLSQLDGDGGISPGKLVFAEDLEQFAGVPYSTILREISSDRKPDAVNLGGPAIVGAINAAQILYNTDAEFFYYGACGDDESGKILCGIAAKTPLNMTHYHVFSGSTPTTDVLSDPSFHNGKGERSFINRIGASAAITPEILGDEFFQADALWFAATALTPAIHDALTSLLRRGRKEGKLNIVSTVFDFRNEKKDPVGPWPLGESAESYTYIDLLIVDFDEALRLSGKKTLAEAAEFLQRSGVSSFFITHGAKNFYGWSDGRLFVKTPDDPANLYGMTVYPVSALADEDLAKYPERRGDTTGCGDNFAGGIVASLIRQWMEGVSAGAISAQDAAAWAAASGGAACFCKGGTFIEKEPGEKLAILRRYATAYPS